MFMPEAKGSARTPLGPISFLSSLTLPPNIDILFSFTISAISIGKHTCHLSSVRKSPIKGFGLDQYKSMICKNRILKSFKLNFVYEIPHELDCNYSLSRQFITHKNTYLLFLIQFIIH